MTDTIRTTLLALLLAAGPVSSALAQQQSGMAGLPRQQRFPPGTYISGPTLPDMTLVLPPPPLPGSPQQAADDDAFHASRSLVGTDRWALAERDSHLATADVLADFSCALGFAIDPHDTPVLVSLIGHAGADMSPALEKAKEFWKRPRPYLGNDLPICVRRHGSLDNNPSYPSGHATLEYGAALILAELVPERATAILQRGRTLAESRIVCGVHWASDVQAGLLEASSLVAALHGSDRFRTDMDRARTELAASRAHAGIVAPTAGECLIEANAAAHPALFQAQSRK